MLQPSKHRAQEFARSVLHTYLLRHVPAESVLWDPVASDPPDYFLTLDRERFAVEVTILMEAMTIGGRPRTTRGVSVSLFRFIDEIEEDARSAGILCGAYALSADPLDDLSVQQFDLKRSALDYIARTRDVDSAPRETILERGADSWWITKLGPHKAYVGGLVGGGGKWEGEANEDVRSLLAEAIVTKERKLAAVIEPAILLLIDAYHFADDAGWTHAVSEQVSGSRFCAVVRIRDNGSCQFLATKQPWPLVQAANPAG